MLRDFEASAVPFNKNATFKIRIIGYDDIINESLSRACLEVAKKGSEQACEMLILVNLYDGEWDYEEKGASNFVALDGFWKFLEGNNNKYAFVHNHPSRMMFSFPDINTFMTTDSIELMIASGHNGKIYYIKGKKHKIGFGSLDMDLMEDCKELLAPYTNGHLY